MVYNKLTAFNGALLCVQLEAVQCRITIKSSKLIFGIGKLRVLPSPRQILLNVIGAIGSTPVSME